MARSTWYVLAAPLSAPDEVAEALRSRGYHARLETGGGRPARHVVYHDTWDGRLLRRGFALTRELDVWRLARGGRVVARQALDRAALPVSGPVAARLTSLCTERAGIPHLEADIVDRRFQIRRRGEGTLRATLRTVTVGSFHLPGERSSFLLLRISPSPHRQESRYLCSVLERSSLAEPTMEDPVELGLRVLGVTLRGARVPSRFLPAREDSVGAELHRLRILFRRLRYGCELFAPLYRPGMRSVTRRLVEIQDLLGDQQDASVVTDRLTGFAKEASLSGQSTPELEATVALLARSRSTALEVSRRRLQALWPTLPKLFRAVRKLVSGPPEARHSRGASKAIA